MNLPSRLGGDGMSLVERLVDALHPDVPRAFERFQEGDESAVRREPRGRDFRIAEEQLTIDERRETGGFGRGLCCRAARGNSH